jgi:epoxyqueuosine reductase QueG
VNADLKFQKHAMGRLPFCHKRKFKRTAFFYSIQYWGGICRAFVDSAPVLDKAWAAKSGLG